MVMVKETASIRRQHTPALMGFYANGKYEPTKPNKCNVQHITLGNTPELSKYQ